MSQGEIHEKPNWLLLKDAAEALYRSGRIFFSRKELVNEAKKRDPARSDMSLDFEIDLVTVNSNSKDKYKDPDKLFLYRVDRGKYTLYNPEEHGDLDKYIGMERYPLAGKQLIEKVLEILEEMGYDAVPNRSMKVLQPDIIAEKEESKIGIWVIDPNMSISTQYKTLAYAIGSCMLNRSFNEYIVIVPVDLYKRITQEVLEVLRTFNIKFATLREERRYSLNL
ncbi:MAG: hypothetical protein QXP02_01995 [Desulfurococcaceae archaeon]